MKYGLNDAEFQLLSDKVINPLKAVGAQVYIFGSRATGKFQKFSDIDLLYMASGERKILPHEIYEITSAIENSNFPYKVDLVAADELAESYRSNVEREKIQV